MLYVLLRRMYIQSRCTPYTFRLLFYSLHPALPKPPLVTLSIGKYGGLKGSSLKSVGYHKPFILPPNAEKRLELGRQAPN